MGNKVHEINPCSKTRTLENMHSENDTLDSSILKLIKIFDVFNIYKKKEKIIFSLSLSSSVFLFLKEKCYIALTNSSLYIIDQSISTICKKIPLQYLIKCNCFPSNNLLVIEFFNLKKKGSLLVLDKKSRRSYLEIPLSEFSEFMPKLKEVYEARIGRKLDVDNYKDSFDYKTEINSSNKRNYSYYNHIKSELLRIIDNVDDLVRIYTLDMTVNSKEKEFLVLMEAMIYLVSKSEICSLKKKIDISKITTIYYTKKLEDFIVMSVNGDRIVAKSGFCEEIISSINILTSFKLTIQLISTKQFVKFKKPIKAKGSIIIGRGSTSERLLKKDSGSMEDITISKKKSIFTIHNSKKASDNEIKTNNSPISDFLTPMKFAKSELHKTELFNEWRINLDKIGKVSLPDSTDNSIDPEDEALDGESISIKELLVRVSERLSKLK